jgi:hypothetical protein
LGAGVQWLKFKSLSSSPSTEKKKKPNYTVFSGEGYREDNNTVDSKKEMLFVYYF